MSNEARTPQPCGYFCTPASDDSLGCTPKKNLPPCDHPKERHYDIDGEFTGCLDCEWLELPF